MPDTASSSGGPSTRRLSVHAAPNLHAGGHMMYDIMAGAAVVGSDDEEEDQEKLAAPMSRVDAVAGGSRTSSLASNPSRHLYKSSNPPGDGSVHRTLSLMDSSSDSDGEETPTFASHQQFSASLPTASSGGKFLRADKSARGADRSINRRISVVHATDAELAAIAQDRCAIPYLRLRFSLRFSRFRCQSSKGSHSLVDTVLVLSPLLFRSNHGSGQDRSVRRSSSRRPTDMDGSFDFEIPSLSRVRKERGEPTGGDPLVDRAMSPDPLYFLCRCYLVFTALIRCVLFVFIFLKSFVPRHLSCPVMSVFRRKANLRDNVVNCSPVTS